MGETLVHQKLVIALQDLVVARLERLGERPESAVALVAGAVALEENPAPLGGEKHVLVVLEPADALAVDFFHLLHARILHIHARDLYGGRRRVDEERLRQKLVHGLEILYHPVELELGGRLLAPDHRHHPAILRKTLRRRERLAHENTRIVLYLALGVLLRPRRTELPALHLRLQTLLALEKYSLDAIHIGFDALLNEESDDSLRDAERHDSGGDAPAHAPVSRIKCGTITAATGGDRNKQS